MISEERAQFFWKTLKPGNSDECWNWPKYRSKLGYGTINIDGKNWKTHRVAFYLRTGELPISVCHKCDNPSCCNPNHLFGGTQKENIRDMVQKGRKVTHRGENHPNTVLTANDVLAIREEYSHGGISYAALGRKYGITDVHTRDLIKRKRWSWL